MKLDRKLDRKPGVREQHLLRKKDNPLFSQEQRSVSSDDFDKARLMDDMDVDRYMRCFEDLVQQAIDLKPNADSQVVLELKEQLDQNYQQICALPGDTEKIKKAILTLLDLVMKSVWKGVGEDAVAQQKLRDEEIARETHFKVQEISLVAALTHEHSPVIEDELVPSLLSESEGDLSITLSLFDDDQLLSLAADASKYLAEQDSSHDYPQAWLRLAQMEKQINERN